MLIPLLVCFAVGQVYVSGYNDFQNVTEGQIPYQVSLRLHDVVYDSDDHYCSGAIISSQWVLTAGRCLDNKRSYRIRVVVGTINLGYTGTWYEVEKAILHENYNSFEVANDIGLLKTKTEIEFNDKVAAALLPFFAPPAGTSCTVSGWGYTNGEGYYSDVLQEATLTTISTEDCRKTDLGRYRFIRQINEKQICAYKDTEGEICLADQGAPLVTSNQLVGLTSYDLRCGANLPSVFVRVYEYKDWIKSHMN